MKMKQIIKILTDLLMTVLLLFLMAYSLAGETVHEWIGITLFILFILHHILNRLWCRNLFRGHYTPVRIYQTILVLLVFICMIGSMASGVLLSRHVFRLDIHRFSAVFQTVHMLCAYWGYLFLSLHLGLHWNGIMGIAGKHIKKSSALFKWIIHMIAALIAIYGAYAFIKQDFGNYMFLRYHFVFFNFEKPLVLFLFDYIAIMGLFVYTGYHISVLLIGKSRNRSFSKTL